MTKNILIPLDQALVILAALERPQAIDSAAKFLLPRDNHAAAIEAMRSAITTARHKRESAGKLFNRRK